jgi:hypothetical protein
MNLAEIFGWRAGFPPGWKPGSTSGRMPDATHQPVHPTFEDGLKNQRVLTAVEESSAKGKWVKL